MWNGDFNDHDESFNAMSKQVLFTMLSITSMCLICTTNGNLFPFIDAVHQLYRDILTKELAIAQFIAFAENKERLDLEMSKRETNRTMDFEMTQFLFRGNQASCLPGDGVFRSCVNKLSDLLHNPELHSSFVQSHTEIMNNIKATNMIQCIAVMLDKLLRIVNLDLDYYNFMVNVPNFSSTYFEQQLQRLEYFQASLKRVRSGKTLEILIKYEDSYILNTVDIEVLQQSFNLHKPTIVMIIMGKPGIGKSTLLNHLIRACTGSRQLLTFFKTGNTISQTTRASQVFSEPLLLGDKQLMLLDLEGLEGMENREEASAILQANLVTAILTVASVPCIIINNSMDSLHFVEKNVGRLCKLKENFGFRIERVHLLFHDRDPRSEGIDSNWLTNFISELNERYFEGQQVLKMRLKPNFTNQANADECEMFLGDLLADSGFPKRNHSGSLTDFNRLLVEMQYIMTQKSTNLDTIKFSEEERNERDRIEHEKKEQLKRIADEIVCPEERMSLTAIFNEQFREFIAQCSSDPRCQSENMKKYMTVTLKNEASLLCLELGNIEYCYRVMKPLSEAELCTYMVEQLENYFQESWWVNTFLARANELALKLKKVGKCYPQENVKVISVLSQLDAKQKTIRNIFLASYGVQIALTALTSGLGATIEGAALAMNVVKAGILFGGITAAGSVAFNVTHSMAINEAATKLYSIKKKTVKLDKKVSSLLQTMSEAHHLVLLAIGSKHTKCSYLLNEFILQALPFMSSGVQAFSDSTLTQSVQFAYQRPLHEGHTKCFIIYLRMKKNTAKRASVVLRQLATSLISRVSLTCMLLDETDEYALPILETAFPRSGQDPESQTPSFLPKIAVFYRNTCNRDDVIRKLAQISVLNVAERIDKFNEQGLKLVLKTVKSEFDKSISRTSQELLAALNDAKPKTEEPLLRV